MDEDQRQRPDSQLPYERWIEHALRHVVSQAIEHVAEHGLPGGHHFYITFRTSDPGVELPQRVRAQYAKEMTIVLQHQFWDLGFDRATQAIQVGLSFGGVPARLVIPLDSVIEFADPHIRYGLRFQPRDELQATPSIVSGPGADPAADTETGASDGNETDAADKEADAGQVVSLDAFRRRSPQG